MLAEIVRRIVAAVAPEQIILFGSYAYGNSQPDSDLDLLVIMLSDPVDPKFALRGLTNPRFGLDLAIQAEQNWIY